MNFVKNSPAEHYLIVHSSNRSTVYPNLISRYRLTDTITEIHRHVSVCRLSRRAKRPSLSTLHEGNLIKVRLPHPVDIRRTTLRF